MEPESLFTPFFHFHSNFPYTQQITKPLQKKKGGRMKENLGTSCWLGWTVEGRRSLWKEGCGIFWECRKAEKNQNVKAFDDPLIQSWKLWASPTQILHLSDLLRQHSLFILQSPLFSLLFESNNGFFKTFFKKKKKKTSTWHIRKCY